LFGINGFKRYDHNGGVDYSIIFIITLFLVGCLDPLDLPQQITKQYVEKLITHLKGQNKLQIAQVNNILLQTEKKLKTLSNIINITIPSGKEITVVVYPKFFDIVFCRVTLMDNFMIF
jgi:hypothetical protein